MKTFIWQRVEKLTDNYHEEGGLLIIAESLERACEIEPKIIGIKPDLEYVCADQLDKKIVFPDSGRC